MKKEIGKKCSGSRTNFRKRGLKSRLPKEIRKLLNLVETTSLKKKVRNLEMSERNQKRKSEKRLEISKSPKRNQKSKYMVAVLFDDSCAQLWEKGEKKMILVKS